MATRENRVENFNIESFNLVRKEADNGSCRGLFQLALYYLKGRGTEQNFNKAFQKFKTASERGVIRASTNMAKCYILGLGVQQDIQKGLEILSKTADSYDDNALYNLFQFYFTDKFNKKNLCEARRYLYHSCNEKYNKALFMYGLLNLNEAFDNYSIKSGVKYLKQAVRQKDRKSMSLLLNLHSLGVCDISKDRGETLLSKLSKSLNSDVLKINYAKALIDGEYVEKDYKKALKLLKMCDKDSGIANFLIAEIYDEGGYGVQAQPLEAFQYYTLALQKGFKYASIKLANYFMEGDVVIQDYLKSLEIIKNNSNSNSVLAENFLRYCNKAIMSNINK